jgi:hypothetical protein
MSSPDSADPADLSDAALARLVVRALAALIVLLLASALVAVAERADDGARGRGSADDPALAAPSPGIGPLPGQPVGPYIEARRAALARLDTGRRVAVVSFTRYVTVTVVDLLDSAELDVEAVVVAAPGGSPAVVSRSDLGTWAQDERERAAQERAELERLLPTVEDADFVRTYREDVERLAALERSVDVAADVVFGAVVVGTVDELQRLARSDAVRLVDVGPGAAVPDHDEVTALRPEETGDAGEPRYRPAAPPS